MEVFLNADAWIALLTLTFLEIILGIDNIIFISIVTGKLPQEKRKKATQIGLFLAMFMRIALLFGITLLIAMKAPWFSFDFGWFSAEITGQALILLLGGLFLIYKSTKEIHEKVDHKGEEEITLKSAAKATFSNVIIQILMIDLIFSVDSILTAVGMTNGLEGALIIMITAVVISVGIMMLFAVPVGNFVNKNPSIQILGLAFLILIGFMLITESMHLSNAELAGQHVGAVPKGYLYFAIAFSLGVEFINMTMRKKK
ncbi:TerC family protein [Flavobacterium gelidilacus]|jgi:predicted tellurium resistance membrane protein TerC|uniref:TerC family protein n=1 Tax=Flavobacterium gelidilacus TaxID=206041 RepID=UPI00041FD68A|nr:TerC family protein [Flavobacterium gelidilacus]